MMRIITILILVSALPTGCDGVARSKSEDAARVPRAGRKYVVQQGDNLYRIAEKAYNNGLEWRHIHEANPWVDPARLQAGQEIAIPALVNEMIDPDGPVSPIHEIGRRSRGDDRKAGDRIEEGERSGGGEGARQHANPGKKRSLWKNLRTTIGKKTLFGLTLDKLSFYLLLACFAHAFFQGFVMWITSNVAFVKDASLKKSLRASFLVEMLSLSTVLLIGAVSLMMVYAGTKDPGAAVAAGESGLLFPKVEEYLSTKGGVMAVTLAVLALYVILSLRFVPQVFSIHKSQAFTVVLLGVVTPHLLALFVLAQRFEVL